LSCLQVVGGCSGLASGAGPGTLPLGGEAVGACMRRLQIVSQGGARMNNFGLLAWRTSKNPQVSVAELRLLYLLGGLHYAPTCTQREFNSQASTRLSELAMYLTGRAASPSSFNTEGAICTDWASFSTAGARLCLLAFYIRSLVISTWGAI